MVGHIGIVGCSAEGAALCYRTIVQIGEELMGEFKHPEISMHTPPLKKYMDLIEGNDWNGVADLMLISVKKLKEIGADFVICPDNTIHQSFPIVEKKSALPWLHIAKEVAKIAKIKGYSNLGLTGTKYLVSSDVYPDILSSYDIGFLRPSEGDLLDLNKIIFGELTKGKINLKSQNRYKEIVSFFKVNNCDGVIMGCTEIPLLMDGVRDVSLPLLDSTRILAKAAVEHAISF